MKKCIKQFAIGLLICSTLQFTGFVIAKHSFASYIGVVYFTGFFFGTIWGCVCVMRRIGGK